MQRAQALAPHDRVEVLQRVAQAFDGANLVARRQQVARIQADPEAIAAAGGIDQSRKLLERTSKRAAGAGGVLEMQVAALGLVECLLDDLARSLDRLAHVALLGRARMQDHCDCSDPRADSQRLNQRGTRLVANLAILRSAVE